MSNKNLNWAVIPCAGLGTRLMPVTRSVPKAMLPVGNYPIIHFAVKEAISIGIENILIIIVQGAKKGTLLIRLLMTIKILKVLQKNLLLLIK